MYLHNYTTVYIFRFKINRISMLNSSRFKRLKNIYILLKKKKKKMSKTLFIKSVHVKISPMPEYQIRVYWNTIGLLIYKNGRNILETALNTRLVLFQTTRK